VVDFAFASNPLSSAAPASNSPLSTSPADPTRHIPTD
jgi:hypothetical protein